ncbi:unnamed protein product [Pleuronectes platessa]|uniref:Uncharacterized protein n=1 Tax=Pleuronectes platessa TaxID=8262 RepID=A0A9N7YQS8_PLEPL|nr:unnamed protein product [Pleuronectes platessa]
MVNKEEVPPEQQQWSPLVDQEDPEPPHIKEQQEEQWTNQEGEQLQQLEQADIKFPWTAVTMKSEEDEEKPDLSQLHQSQTEESRADCGEQEPARNSGPDGHLQQGTEDKTEDSSETEDSEDDWMQTREPQSVLMVQGSETSLPSLTHYLLSVRKSLIQLQVGSGTLSCVNLSRRRARVMVWNVELKSTNRIPGVGAGGVKVLEDEVESHVDCLVYRPVGSVGKLQRVKEVVGYGLEMGQHKALKGLHYYRGQGDWSVVVKAFDPLLFGNGDDDVQQLMVNKEGVPHEQEQWSPLVDQEDPEPPHIKEEQGEPWTNQEGEQLQQLEQADIKFPWTAVTMKSEEDEEKPELSQLHQSQTEENRADCGEQESARNSGPDGHLQQGTEDKTEDSSETEDTRMPRDHKTPPIQKIAKQACITGQGPKSELISPVTTVRRADLKIAPRKSKPSQHVHLRDGGVQHGGVPAEARPLHTAARPPAHERESTELLIRKLPFQRIQLARRIRGHRA